MEPCLTLDFMMLRKGEETWKLQIRALFLMGEDF